MKQILTFTAISLLFFLASCKTVLNTPNLTEKSPDILNKPTETVLAQDTKTELPRGTWVKTDPDEKTSVILEEDTVAEIKTQSVVDSILSAPKTPDQVVLPKNTEVVLPPNTHLKTTDGAVVKIEAGTHTTLPAGTEIAITKINWYAVLFYVLVIFGLAWYYIQIRKQPEDQNGDGFVDNDKVVVGKKKIKATKKQ
jgi:hypothetical protein